MALDSQYMIAPSLQEYFVDKDTGLPLAAGIVTFYSDLSRTDKKSIYMLSGTAPNYTYVELPNPVTLSAVGTFADDNGNDIIPYYYPYDADGNVELYYVTVESAGEVPQFTREAWPNLVNESSSTSLTLTNFIPNGQFLAHNNTPDDGEIVSEITNIAQGGWTFERPDDSTATDTVTFERFGSYVGNPTASPRFAVNIECSSADSGDAYKDLRIKFRDVNKFSSEENQYTFSFTAISNGSDFDVDIDVIKNYGTGGSPSDTETINISEQTIGQSYEIFNIPFVFGSNSGKSIGTNDDDFVQIAISFPNSLFNGTFTDFVLTAGNINITTFPTETDAEMLAGGVAGWMPIPDPDGMDIACPLVLTREGLRFDRSNIGKICSNFYLSDEIGELNCYGQMYEYAAYSDDGIPYSRLGDKLWRSDLSVYCTGTGDNYFTAYPFLTSSTLFRISTNSTGAPVANAVDVSTGFTITKITTGANYGVKALTRATETCFVIADVIGAFATATAGNSGFTVSTGRSDTSLKQLYYITAIAASGLAGKYFTFVNGTDHVTAYYMWFRVDGAGADPAPGGTGIRVDLLSGWNAGDVQQVIREAMNGSQITTISTVAGSLINSGSYFNIDSVDHGEDYPIAFYVWYTVNGIGNDPEPANRTGIQVDILSSDTAAQVLSKTRIAVNRKYYQTPDLRGMFIRGYDPDSEFDADSNLRYTNVSNLYGNNIGTYEIDSILQHSHGVSDSGHFHNAAASMGGSFAGVGAGSPNVIHIDIGSPSSGTSSSTASATTGVTIQSTGSYEVAPFNAYVKFIIKY